MYVCKLHQLVNKHVYTTTNMYILRVTHCFNECELKISLGVNVLFDMSTCNAN